MEIGLSDTLLSSTHENISSKLLDIFETQFCLTLVKILEMSTSAITPIPPAISIALA